MRSKKLKKPASVFVLVLMVFILAMPSDAAAFFKKKKKFMKESTQFMRFIFRILQTGKIDDIDTIVKKRRNEHIMNWLFLPLVADGITSPKKLLGKFKGAVGSTLPKGLPMSANEVIQQVAKGLLQPRPPNIQQIGGQVGNGLLPQSIQQIIDDVRNVQLPQGVQQVIGNTLLQQGLTQPQQPGQGQQQIRQMQQQVQQQIQNIRARVMQEAHYHTNLVFGTIDSKISNVEQQFNKIYPGIDKYVRLGWDKLAPVTSKLDRAQAKVLGQVDNVLYMIENRWTETRKKNIRTALARSAAINDDIKNNEKEMKKAKIGLQVAMGHTQALNAIGAASLMQAKSLMNAAMIYNQLVNMQANNLAVDVDQSILAEAKSKKGAEVVEAAIKKYNPRDGQRL